MKDANFAPAYLTLYPALAELARVHGYALAVHGSMVRDFDLVAIPWTDESTEPQVLALSFAKRVGLLFGYGLRHMKGEPELKPHGRLAWCIPLGDNSCGSAIDLSVIPRLVRQQVIQPKDQEDLLLYAQQEFEWRIQRVNPSHVYGFAKDHDHNYTEQLTQAPWIGYKAAKGL